MSHIYFYTSLYAALMCSFFVASLSLIEYPPPHKHLYVVWTAQLVMSILVLSRTRSSFFISLPEAGVFKVSQRCWQRCVSCIYIYKILRHSQYYGWVLAQFRMLWWAFDAPLIKPHICDLLNKNVIIRVASSGALTAVKSYIHKTARYGYFHLVFLNKIAMI